MGYHNDLAKTFIEDGRLFGAVWDDDFEKREYLLSDQDVAIIQEALERKFVQVKKNRTEVIHAWRVLENG